MGIYVGNKEMLDAYVGDKKVKEIYLGDKLVYPINVEYNTIRETINNLYYSGTTNAPVHFCLFEGNTDQEQSGRFRFPITSGVSYTSGGYESKYRQVLNCSNTTIKLNDAVKNTSSISFSIMIKLNNSLSGTGIFGGTFLMVNATKGGYSLGIDPTGHAIFEVHGSDGKKVQAIGTEVLLANKWYNIMGRAYKLASGNYVADMWIDGTYYTQNANIGSNISYDNLSNYYNGSSIHFGAAYNNGWSQFSGQIQDFVIYNTVLSSSAMYQISNYYLRQE